MQKVQIAHTDLEVSRINFGANVFGWTLDERQSFEILDALAEGGINFIDTADTYSWWVNGVGGQSEAIIGKWLKSRGKRTQMVIATKVGSETQVHPKDISKQHILKSVDASLQRLQTDHIDLYYTHFDDNVTTVAETLEAYDEIIKAGKVRYIAASNVSPKRLLESFKVSEENKLAKYVALQPHYNLVERDHYESDYAPIVEKYGLSVMTYFSLASGFLSGKYRSTRDLSKSARGQSASRYLNPIGLQVIKALDLVAEKHHSQVATVSLAWLLSRPHIAAPIVSATSQTQLQSLFDAPELKLDTEDLALLETASK